MQDRHAPVGALATTGIDGLDEILDGGFPRNRMLLVVGEPGAGKTTLSLQFLLAGARDGEAGLYILLSETESELREVALSHGFDLEGITVLDLATSEESLAADAQYTLFHPEEVELSDTTRMVLETVDRVRPRRVVFDSLSEMRLLARDPLRFRRQILALKDFFTERECAVVLLDYPNSGPHSGEHPQMESLAHGVIVLDHRAQEHGRDRRRLRVQKMRGRRYRDGYHDFNIEKGGIKVFPRLASDGADRRLQGGRYASGVAELDALLGGAIEGGTSTLLLGPAGVGKSTLVSQYTIAAARRGERSAVYLFDEVVSTFAIRGEGLGMGICPFLEDDTIAVRHINPSELSPGEFAFLVKQAVERDGCRIVVIDSLNGYRSAMPEDHFLSEHIHELLSYLCDRGVATFLVLAQHGILGEVIQSPVDLSYVADTVILMRYFEVRGEVRQAISVVKKRTGRHERTIREVQSGAGGLQVGPALTQFGGVLSGRIEYFGGEGELMRPEFRSASS